MRNPVETHSGPEKIAVASPQITKPDPYFITPKQAASILQISTRSLYEVIRGNRGLSKPRAVRFGKLVRFPRDDFIEWAKAQTYMPPNPKRKK
jgi:excisionase family DNA binding protein